MTIKNESAIKIRHISIRDYKGIDFLELEFPAPRMANDPDIFVLGSENGVGKTSVLECCALILHAVSLDVGAVETFDRHNRVDLPSLLIRSGAEHFEIRAVLDVGRRECVRVQLRMDRLGRAEFSTDSPDGMSGSLPLARRAEAEDVTKEILGMTSDPALGRHFIMFHSFRKVTEGNANLGALVDRKKPVGAMSYLESSEQPISRFKYLMLIAVLGHANLLDIAEDVEMSPELTSEKLNELFSSFASGKLGRLRPRGGNTLEFLLDPNHGGEPFSYDGLSSGQKEIISTLALVWFHTQSQRNVVLIDEPELHLNHQWHRRFVNTLIELAPQNQYILATHSEDIMDSVERRNRILLKNEDRLVAT